MTTDNEIHAALQGEVLNTVAFVMDYVEFHFNGPRIRALNCPRVTIQGVMYQFPQEGSRDALCKLIEQVVKSVDFIDEVRLSVYFTSGDEVTIPLDQASYSSPEGMHWLPDNGSMPWYI